MGLILLFLFIFIPALEFYLLFTIGGEIGAGNTLLIIIATGFLGAHLTRSQGMVILQKVQSELATGKLPAREIIHGFLVFGGGLLLLTPGFFTDILGFCMVLPGTRHSFVLFFQSFLTKAMQNGSVKFYNFGSGAMGGKNQNPFEADSTRSVEGDVFEADFERKDS